MDPQHLIYRSTLNDFFLVELVPDGRTFRPTRTDKLFNSLNVLQGVWQYSIDRTGQKLLMIAPPEQTRPEGSEPLQVIVNWVAGLKTR